jgi:hypothetical protein
MAKTRHLYKILENRTIDVLQIYVNQYLQDGWQLAGGVTYAKFLYIQAIFFNVELEDDDTD